MEKQLPAIKQGQDQSSSGSGQPAKQDDHSNEVDVNAEAAAIAADADKILAEQVPDLQGEEDEEDKDFVKVKKSDIEKQKNALKNYGTGLKSLKERASKLGPIKKQEEENKDSGRQAASGPTGDQPSPQPDRVIQVNQKKAIAEACKDPDLEKNWGEVMKYFKYTRDPDLVENIVADIDDAYTLWQKHNKKNDQSDNGNRDAQRQISNDSSRQGGDSGQGGTGGKKSIIPKRSPIQTWFPKKE